MVKPAKTAAVPDSPGRSDGVPAPKTGPKRPTRPGAGTPSETVGEGASPSTPAGRAKKPGEGKPGTGKPAAKKTVDAKPRVSRPAAKKNADRQPGDSKPGTKQAGARKPGGAKPSLRSTPLPDGDSGSSPGTGAPVTVGDETTRPVAPAAREVLTAAPDVGKNPVPSRSAVAAPSVAVSDRDSTIQTERPEGAGRGTGRSDPRTAAPAEPRRATPGPRRGRRVKRIIRRIELWSVLKLSLVLLTCLYLAVLGTLVVIWGVAYSSGQIENLQEFLADVGLENYRFYGDRMFKACAAIGAVGVLAGTVLAVLTTALINLISEITGGIRVVVIEEDPPPRR